MNRATIYLNQGEGWNSSEVMGEEELKAWRLAPRTLIRKLQNGVIHSARPRSIFSDLSSQSIQLIHPTLLFSLWLTSQLNIMAVTPQPITGGEKGMSHYLVIKMKKIHSSTARENSALASLGNWRLWINFYTDMLINMAVRFSAALIKYSTWGHCELNSFMGTTWWSNTFLQVVSMEKYALLWTIYQVTDFLVGFKKRAK